MNNSYKIFVDTGCDIDPELIKGEYVTVIPGSYTVGSTLTKYDGLDDGGNLTKFYDRQRDGDVTQTIAITKEVFENTFSRLVRHGIGVIYIALSSRLSNQYYSAQEVKMEMEAKYGSLPLYIVDSRSATGGIGILAEIAVANKMSGYPISTECGNIEFHCRHCQKLVLCERFGLSAPKWQDLCQQVFHWYIVGCQAGS